MRSVMEVEGLDCCIILSSYESRGRCELAGFLEPASEAFVEWIVAFGRNGAPPLASCEI